MSYIWLMIEPVICHKQFKGKFKSQSHIQAINFQRCKTGIFPWSEIRGMKCFFIGQNLSV